MHLHSKQNQSKAKKILFIIGDIILNLAILIGLVFVIRTYFVKPFHVFGPSMCDTINYIDGECTYDFGELIIVDRFSYQNFFGWQVSTPQRGDIVVFNPPAGTNHSDEVYIKRIIGLPGETIRIENGEVIIENEKNPEGTVLEEPYLNEQNRDHTEVQQFNLNNFKVPADKYFVMGDNRQASTDSRSCFKRKFSDSCNDDAGYISLIDIQGKAWLTFWPFSKIRIIQHGDYPGNQQ